MQRSSREGGGVSRDGIPVETPVIPAKAEMHFSDITFPNGCERDSRFRGNDALSSPLAWQLAPLPPEKIGARVISCHRVSARRDQGATSRQRSSLGVRPWLPPEAHSGAQKAAPISRPKKYYLHGLKKP